MAKFKFELQNILRIKEKLESQRKTEFGEAIAYREKQKQIKQELVDQKQDEINNFRESLGEKIQPEKTAVYNDYIQVLKHRITKQEDVIIEAKKQTELRRQALESAMKEHKIFGKLRENRLNEFRIEEVKAEQKETDERISYKYSQIRKG